jgi:anti-sigma B factor antagonist/stage II sporulation protein AA (anti-sigma F factor antagonist)
VVLDLGEVDYMSSAGLRVLMIAARANGSGKGRLVVCGLQSVMKEIFAISRFDTLLDVYATRGAAREALGG